MRVNEDTVRSVRSYRDVDKWLWHQRTISSWPGLRQFITLSSLLDGIIFTLYLYILLKQLATHMHILSTVSLLLDISWAPTRKCILVILMSGCWPSKNFLILCSTLSTQFHQHLLSISCPCATWQRCKDWFLQKMILFYMLGSECPSVNETQISLSSQLSLQWRDTLNTILPKGTQKKHVFDLP